MAETSEFLEFHVTSRESDGLVWKIFVDSAKNQRGGLDESLEGASVWWGGSSTGGADVLSVIPENEQLNLRFATSEPPGEGGRVRVYPPRYLEALLQRWSDTDWAEICLSKRDQIEKGDVARVSEPLKSLGFPWLRRAQRDALSLTSRDVGFLWGPPGTGKTTTLGVLAARFLLTNRDARILLCATTNTAVDQLLISVDSALESLGTGEAAELRQRCSRLGNHFILSNYEKRSHLIPVKDTSLIKRLTSIESQRPPKESVNEYAVWKQHVEEVRAEIRRQAKNVLLQARVVALTSTRAAFGLIDLRSVAPFDLVIFDESSQAGLAHVLALIPLGRQVLFSGDPMQLAPIVQSKHPAAERWLGKSIFEYMKSKAPWTCTLDEQSRMAESICTIVSDVFYDGVLKVANDKKRDAKWLRERELYRVADLGVDPFVVKHIHEEGNWSEKFAGPIRFESAISISKIARSLSSSYGERDVAVLTPFRAQRTLIRSLLREVKNVRVSTVHRAQGDEYHTVLFDPVQGDSNFLKTDDARRLVNVALSRAKARLVLFVSPGDRKNPLFDQIVNVSGNAHLGGRAEPIGVLIKRNDFPSCCIGRVFISMTLTCKGLAVIENGKKLEVLNLETGESTKLDVDFLKRKYGI